jgi:hypothetical protein
MFGIGFPEMVLIVVAAVGVVVLWRFLLRH